MNTNNITAATSNSDNAQEQPSPTETPISEAMVLAILKRGAGPFLNRIGTADPITSLLTATDRYLTLIDHFRPELSRQEWLLICDASWSCFTFDEVHETAKQVVLLEIEYACGYEGLDQKWAVDGQALIHKLENLDMASHLAILHVVEVVKGQHGLTPDAALDFAGIPTANN